MRKTVIQLLKFAVVGLSNTAISLAVYYVLLSLGFNYIVANVIGFIISVLNAYYWSRKYVFTSSVNQAKTIARVYVSYGLTFLLSNFLLYFLVDHIGVSEKIAPIDVLLFTVPANFLLNKFWAFRD